MGPLDAASISASLIFKLQSLKERQAVWPSVHKDPWLSSGQPIFPCTG